MANRRVRVTVPIPKSSGNTSPASNTSSTTSTTSPTPPRSPFLPTPLETVLVAIYPGTLVLGSLFSILNSTTRNTPYSATTQSHPAALAPSYFARKSNVFNQYFVKLGWFWTTLAFWCFGPPIIDRGFRFTGGQCELVHADTARAQAGRAAMSDARQLLTNAACKAVGGTWKGGYDISGHVFLLILGSGMLWMEMLPAVIRAEGLREERRVRLRDGAVRSAAGNVPVPPAQDLGLGVKVALAVTALSWWMLLMTAAYFHTWFEKFTGLIVAFAGLYVVYFLPRAFPPLRDVLGMPGV
ncbi:hypothetical protein B0A49_11113 [Cryomyces minteri]|uniref:FIT family protein scs3 n=1 Tax=Cryomyces minteri TaxID=331657 RepID=A0A4U0W757_9PEZI|nr:hypothetical protein B0A49_11113 [Cryomyces minteri]